MAKLKSFIKNTISDVKTYWHKPKEGDYISYKEFSLFCLGASANNSALTVLGYLTFTAGCFLVGAIYGIAFKDIYIIGLINIPLGYIWNIFNMQITDNLGDLPKSSAKKMKIVLIPLFIVGVGLFFVPQYLFENIIPALPQIIGGIITVNIFNIVYRIFVLKKLAPKYGKYRPWILTGVFPTLIFLALIVYLPYKAMPYHTRLWVLHLMFAMFGLFTSFTAQLSNIQNVISPNTEERVKVMSAGAFVYSLLPSLVGIIIPILAGTGGLNNIKLYRTIVPIMAAIFSLMSLILFFGVKEKVVIAKTHKPQISFWQGSKAVLKNKYFWITNLSGVGNAITAGSIILATIMFVYSSRQDWMLGIFSGITGTAYIPGLLLTTFFIKKIGKKNLLLFSKLINIAALGGQFLALKINNVVLFIFFAYINILLCTPSNIGSQAMIADIWDYQQYLTGERLDGFSGVFGLIFTPITMVLGMLIPTLYGRMGFTTDWDILYNNTLRASILNATLFVGIAANVLSAIPYLFYDLTEDKHKEIIKVLKQREQEEDAKHLAQKEAAASIDTAAAE